MATAHLANMPAIAGLYAFIAGSLAFALIGRNPHVSVGADSTIAPVLAAGAAVIATAGTPRYTDAIELLTLMAGALVLAVGVLRLGWVAQFLSTPVITGVLAGIGIEIVARQLPVVLGLAPGGSSTVARLRGVVDHVGDINGWAVGIAVAVLVVVVVAERVNPRVPGALIGLGASVLVVG